VVLLGAQRLWGDKYEVIRCSNMQFGLLTETGLLNMFSERNPIMQAYGVMPKTHDVASLVREKAAMITFEQWMRSGTTNYTFFDCESGEWPNCSIRFS